MRRLAAVALWPQAIGHIDVVAWNGQTVLVASRFTLMHGLARRRSSAPVEPPRPARGGPVLAGLAAADIVALQMGEVPGLRVHRSWFANGVEAPVSRANATSLHAAGLKPE